MCVFCSLILFCYNLYYNIHIYLCIFTFIYYCFAHAPARPFGMLRDLLLLPVTVFVKYFSLQFIQFTCCTRSRNNKSISIINHFGANKQRKFVYIVKFRYKKTNNNKMCAPIKTENQNSWRV